MSAIPLLRGLLASGIEITTDGCKVRWRDAYGRLDVVTLDALRAEKAAVIAFLEAEDYRADRFEELAAILEYDEHMPRAEAEHRARRIVYGAGA
ncbi:hypothetical protein [Amaricoccus solimangrovi]|uniref:TubC N-terminal docking domain-containing protein n=1 Tax=Amaricoccus solimangrovi TaxID=2589815 RepID=A0A501WWX8_9RHOB|nr:hypothetical protein [Amaricoccus solimangrovi]TPE53222.1 hypothetical protein FJM51_04170 [Amaricoccus solimangrovi]